MAKSVAFYDQTKRKERIAAIRTTATTLNLNPVSIKNPDPLDAIAVVMSSKKNSKKTKKAPILIGYLQDLQAPEGMDITDEIWIECVLCLIDQEGIDFHPMDSKSGSQVDLATNIIRKYHKAFTHLTDSLRKRLTPPAKKYGRPPYGYHMEEGKMVVDQNKSEAVRFIFQQIRNGVSSSELLIDLKKKFKIFPGDKKKQFWDKVKLRRIIEKARLYCLGEYQVEGTILTTKNLAFLPSDWADTVWPTHQGASS